MRGERDFRTRCPLAGARAPRGIPSRQGERDADVVQDFPRRCCRRPGVGAPARRYPSVPRAVDAGVRAGRRRLRLPPGLGGGSSTPRHLRQPCHRHSRRDRRPARVRGGPLLRLERRARAAERALCRREHDGQQPALARARLAVRGGALRLGRLAARRARPRHRAACQPADRAGLPRRGQPLFLHHSLHAAVGAVRFGSPARALRPLPVARGPGGAQRARPGRRGPAHRRAPAPRPSAHRRRHVPGRDGHRVARSSASTSSSWSSGSRRSPRSHRSCWSPRSSRSGGTRTPRWERCFPPS